jgi:hypothetical protein
MPREQSLRDSLAKMEWAVMKSAGGGAILLVMGLVFDNSTLFWIGFGVLVGAGLRLLYTSYFAGADKS